MPTDDDLCLCCGTISHAGFRELVEAASAGGFRSISIWPHHYKCACAEGLSGRDMRLMLEDHGVVISELDPLLNWLPGASPVSEASESERAFFSPTEGFFFHIADALSARHLNVVQAFGSRMNTEILQKPSLAFVTVPPNTISKSLWSFRPDLVYPM